MKIFGIALGAIGIYIVASEGWILGYAMIILGIILWLSAQKRGVLKKCPKCGIKRMGPTPNEIELGGKKIKLFLGYTDKSVLRALNFKDEVTFLKERAKLVFLDSIEEIFYFDRERASSKFHLLNATTIICCAIEGLGHYLTGTDDSFGSFKTFVEEFMDPSFQKTLIVDGEEVTYSRIVWQDFRNGLAHGFYIKRGGIERGKGDFSFDPHIGLQIDIDFLFSDFKRGFEKFFDRLQSSYEESNLGEKFLKRFNKLLEKYDVNYQMP